MRLAIALLMAAGMVSPAPSFACQTLGKAKVASSMSREVGSNRVTAQALNSEADSTSKNSGFTHRFYNQGPERVAFAWWGSNGELINIAPSWAPLEPGEASCIEIEGPAGAYNLVAPSSFKINTNELWNSPAYHFALIPTGELTSTATQRFGLGKIGTVWEELRTWMSVTISRVEGEDSFSIQVSTSGGSAFALDANFFPELEEVLAIAEEQGASTEIQSIALLEGAVPEGLEAFQDTEYVVIEASGTLTFGNVSMQASPAPFVLLTDGEPITAAASFVDDLVVVVGR